MRQADNQLSLEPYTLNQKIYKDNDGNISSRRDTVFVNDVDEIRAHIDQTVCAPAVPSQSLKNLNFSFVGRDNQLLVNIDEVDAHINKRNIYVTVVDIPDMNGNYMASPATHSMFVDRNPLRWSQRTLTCSTAYGQEGTATINIVNNSGASHTYTIEELPQWLTVSTPSDVIDAKGETVLTLTISKDTNVGNYDEVIYVTDENGLSEPLTLNVEVAADAPVWSVSKNLQNYSMNIVGRVMIGTEIVTDAQDLVGVFDTLGRCMGVNHVDYDASKRRVWYISPSMTAHRSSARWSSSCGTARRAR